MSILKRWYSGDLYPDEQTVPRDTAYHSIVRKIGKEREYFEAKLSLSQDCNGKTQAILFSGYRFPLQSDTERLYHQTVSGGPGIEGGAKSIIVDHYGNVYGSNGLSIGKPPYPFDFVASFSYVVTSLCYNIGFTLISFLKNLAV